MKILVLGNSDTQGVFVDGPTWSAVVRERVGQQLGGEVELTEVGFSAVSISGVAYAERKVRELSPDLVNERRRRFLADVRAVAEQHRYRLSG